MFVYVYVCVCVCMSVCVCVCIVYGKPEVDARCLLCIGVFLFCVYFFGRVLDALELEFQTVEGYQVGGGN